jgi:ubiquinone/menaquinone biosynthesis C-methylase UbiE
MRNINLLETYPKTKRNLEEGWRTEKNKIIAKRYDKEFFDGDRANGYGGYYYDGRWKKVVKKIQEVYGVNKTSAVLDIGCAKGFLLYDLQEMIPGIRVAGIDISEYAVNHAMEGYSKYIKNSENVDEKKANLLETRARKTVLPHMIIQSAETLPWPDNSFDAIISINTTHNLPRDKCINSIKEMTRVCKNKNNIFIHVDAYTNKEEKRRMENWVLTAETFLSDKEWLKLFNESGYDGDYSWNIV